jgi:hypothetical protein
MDPPEAEGRLRSSDPATLAGAAVALAGSSEARHLRSLGKELRSGLAVRLAGERYSRGHRCYLGPVFRHLTGNRSPVARREFEALLQSPALVKDADRADELIRASGVLRPPTAAVLRFWRDHAKPQDGFVGLAFARSHPGHPLVGEGGTRP